MTERRDAARDEGRLRAYLDNELSAAERQAVQAALAASPQMRQELAALQNRAAQVQATLDTPAVAPDPQAAWHRVHAAIANQPAVAPDNSRRNPMKNTLPNWLGAHRALAASLAVVVVLLGLLTLPPVRALADQVLQVFRVQEVVFVPVSEDRIAELESLDFDGSTLFVSEPTPLEEPAEPVDVASAAAAADMVGYPVREPQVFPAEVTATEFRVFDDMVVEFQVDVEGVRSLLDLLAIDDVTIPDALGAGPIQADIGQTVGSRYASGEYEVLVTQGQSPNLSLPEGVDLEQMGIVLLRVLGMSPEQAAAMAANIDWNSTLVVPFPQDVSAVQEVQINGLSGMLIRGEGSAMHGEDNQQSEFAQVYFQDGERFTVVYVTGPDLDGVDIVAIAESLN